MTAAGVLVVLALLDGSFSGVRAWFGRTGLIRHRAEDLRAGVRGVAVVTVCAVPALALFLVDVGLLSGGTASYERAAGAMLLVVGPYAVAVLLAMAVYFCVGWEQKFVAMAFVLGPFTLLRPAVTLVAAVAAVASAGDPLVALVMALSTAAVLAVEPLLNRSMSRRLTRSGAAGGGPTGGGQNRV